MQFVGAGAFGVLLMFLALFCDAVRPVGNSLILSSSKLCWADQRSFSIGLICPFPKIIIQHPSEPSSRSDAPRVLRFLHSTWETVNFLAVQEVWEPFFPVPCVVSP